MTSRSAFFRPLRFSLTLAVVSAFAACGDSSGPDTTAASISKVSGDGQSARISTSLTSPLRVRVSNASGDFLEGILVEFSVQSGIATLAPSQDVTDAFGSAETSVTFGAEGGDVQIAASVPGSQATPAVFTVTALAPTTIELVSGDGQVGGRNATFGEPLRARVRDQRGNGFSGASVDWVIVSAAGAGAALDSTPTTTNAQGIASTTGRYGDTEGDYVIEASIAVVGAVPAQFALAAVVAPVITSIAPSPMQEGTTATLSGQSFSPDPGLNTVTVDGLAATVLTASATELTITVPRLRCLPARDSAVVIASVGSVAGPTFYHPTIPGDAPLALASGAHVIRTDSAGVECVQVPASGSAASYLVISAVTQDSVTFSAAELLERSQGTSTLFGVGGYTLAPAASAAIAQETMLDQVRALEFSRAFESSLRAYERRTLVPGQALARRAALRAQGAANLAIGLAAVPSVGDTLDLKVPTSTTEFVPIKGVVQYVGVHGIAVEDTARPDGGFTTTDYAQIIDEFDASIYPIDTLYFASPSDIDDNQRVLILFTPEVNKLTPAGAGGFIAGFFFAVDLFAASVFPSSNEAEIFYMLAPDPTGEINGNQRSTSFVRQLTRGVVAHEFQHLVNAVEKIERNAPSLEQTWLDEGLAHLAEEVVGHAITGRTTGSDLTCADVNCSSDDFNAFYQQNFLRARLYLRSDSIAKYSPLGPQDDLMTRGAIWLLLRWLLDQEGSARAGGEVAITRALVQTTQTGIPNLEGVIGIPFRTFAPEWLAALYTDNLGVSSSRLEITSWDVRDILGSLGGYPLVPTPIGFTDGSTSFSVRNGSGRFFLLSSGGASPALSLKLTGSAGAALDLSALVPRTILVRLP